MNFWQSLERPILALAPMAGITDLPFRRICADFGADVVVSEMANVSALKYQPAKTVEMLRSAADEPNYVIQLFGAEPEHFALAAALLSDEAAARQHHPGYHKPKGLDINFGCPVSKVLKTGSGAKLFQDLPRAVAVIEQTIANTDLPVSVKIRSAAGQVDWRQFLAAVRHLPIAALMIHGRSLAQGFAGPADTQAIAELKAEAPWPVLANGGVNTAEAGRRLLADTGADGLGLARGVLGRPWLFAELKDENFSLSRQQLFAVIRRHAQLVATDNNYFVEFRKHLCWYVSGLRQASQMRAEAIRISSLAELEAFVDKWQEID